MLQIFAQKLYKIKIEDEKKGFHFPTVLQSDLKDILLLQ